MRILLDCRPLQYAGSGAGPGSPADNEQARFILSCAALLAAEQGVEWLYLVDHRYRPGQLPGLPGSSGSSGSSVLIRRAGPGKVGWRWWYGWLLPRVAKKYKVEGVMMTGGLASGPLPLPQYIWMTSSAPYSASRAKNLLRAAAIFCFSEKDRSSLVSRQPEAENKVVVIQPGPDATVAPLSFEERETAKSEYAGGKEYFLAIVPSAGQKELVNLLKAFSLFKRRQRSNMQLVIIDRDPPSGKDWKEKLSTYKYREDLHWADPPSPAGITGAAYALLLPFAGDIPGIPILNAWKAGVPVIAGPELSGIAGEAALAGGPGDPAALAAQLMLLYKDEPRRNDLIEKGKDRLQHLTRTRPGDEVWKVLQKIN
jgi:hypothetical protein